MRPGTVLASQRLQSDTVRVQEPQDVVVGRDEQRGGVGERLVVREQRGVDVSVVGCDDIFGADFCNPPLTTMTSPIERAGQVAIRMLLGRLGAPPADGAGDEHTASAVALPTHLTVRESTGPAPGGGP